MLGSLQQNQKETWTAVVTKSAAAKEKVDGPEKWAAEMVAALYDESLDAFAGHNWMTRFNIFRHDYSRMHTVFANQPRNFQQFHTSWGQGHEHVEITYRSFPADLTANLWRYAYFARGRGLSVLASEAVPTPRLPCWRMQHPPPWQKAKC